MYLSGTARDGIPLVVRTPAVWCPLTIIHPGNHNMVVLIYMSKLISRLDKTKDFDRSSHTQRQRMNNHPDGRSEHQCHCSETRSRGSPCTKRSAQMMPSLVAHCLALWGSQFCRLQSSFGDQQASVESQEGSMRSCLSSFGAFH